MYTSGGTPSTAAAVILVVHRIAEDIFRVVGFLGVDNWCLALATVPQIHNYPSNYYW